MTISHQLRRYLEDWHRTSTTRKSEDGIQVDLSFGAFLALFSEKNLETLENAIWYKRLRYLQDKANPLALVVTWKSYAARSTNAFNSETAIVCARYISKRISLVQPGDALRVSHAANIGEALRGKPKTDDHRANISESCKGKPKALWTEERKAARRALNEAKRPASTASDDYDAHGSAYST